MTNDNNEHGYDELRWLAKDTRTKRRRTMWWTAGITLGAMALATAYVRSNQDGSGNGAGGGPTIEVSADLDEIESTLEDIEAILRGANLEPQINVQVDVVPAPTPPGESQQYFSNVVWLVDGTRRVPVTEGDTVWISEASSWVRLFFKGTEGTSAHSDPATREVTEVEIWGRDYGAEPGQKLPLPQYLSVNEEAAGVSNCIEIASRGPSTRPGFTQTSQNGVALYLDIEIRFDNSIGNSCP